MAAADNSSLSGQLEEMMREMDEMRNGLEKMQNNLGKVQNKMQNAIDKMQQDIDKMQQDMNDNMNKMQKDVDNMQNNMSRIGKKFNAVVERFRCRRQSNVEIKQRKYAVPANDSMMTARHVVRGSNLNRIFGALIHKIKPKGVNVRMVEELTDSQSGDLEATDAERANSLFRTPKMSTARSTPKQEHKQMANLESVSAIPAKEPILQSITIPTAKKNLNKSRNSDSADVTTFSADTTACDKFKYVGPSTAPKPSRSSSIPSDREKPHFSKRCKATFKNNSDHFVHAHNEMMDQTSFSSDIVQMTPHQQFNMRDQFFCSCCSASLPVEHHSQPKNQQQMTTPLQIVKEPQAWANQQLHMSRPLIVSDSSDLNVGDVAANSKTSIPEELIFCRNCGRTGHPAIHPASCLQFKTDSLSTSSGDIDSGSINRETMNEFKNMLESVDCDLLLFATVTETTSESSSSAPRDVPPPNSPDSF